MNMKKKNIVMIVIVLLIIIAIAGWFIYRQIEKNGREYEIEKINVQDYAYSILRQEGKYGVINNSGDVVINPTYTNVIIPNPQKAVFVCYDENNNTKILNENNEQIFSEYTQIQPIRLKNIASDLMYEKNLLTYQDIIKYNKQYHNLKVIYDNTFHDRYFILDNKIVYHCGTSINRIGYKTFSITLINDEEICQVLINKIDKIKCNYHKNL